ncbi:hypothetical protein MAR_026341, partial [Mya arenaria]
MDRSFATKLNTVLEEIGVSKDLIWKRRRTFLMRECLVNHSRVLRSLDEVNVFYLGSQSEGTTTVGMMSDTDQLECINHWEAILTLEDWTYGKDETSPPQYCNLQMFRYDQPLPYTDDTMQDYIRDSQGRILLQNTFIYNYRLKHIAETLQLHVRCMSYISAQKISNNTQGRSQMIELYTMEHEYLETLSNHSDDLMRRTFSMLNPFLISLTESVKLAAKIDNHERIAANDIFERFVIPKDPAHISNLLKCASICISCRHFEKATDILNYVEGLIKPYVVQFSGCYQRENPKFNDEFHSRLVEFIDNDEHLLRSSVAMSVKFGRLEIPCVPKHLVFEMYRTFRAVDKTDRHPHNDMWMDAAVVDAIPFLHYL